MQFFSRKRNCETRKWRVMNHYQWCLNPFHNKLHVTSESLFLSFDLRCRILSQKLLFNWIWKASINWCRPFEVIIWIVGSWNSRWMWWSDCTSWRWCFHWRISRRVHWRNTHQFSFLKKVNSISSILYPDSGYQKSVNDLRLSQSFKIIKSGPLITNLFAYRTCQREKANVHVSPFSLSACCKSNSDRGKWI